MAAISVVLGLQAESRVPIRGPRYDSNLQSVEIRVASKVDTVKFSAHFESEVGFSITSRDGVTPATFSVEAKSFNAVIDPKPDANIRVEATTGGLSSSYSGSSAVRIVKEEGDFSVSAVKSEENE